MTPPARPRPVPPREPCLAMARFLAWREAEVNGHPGTAAIALAQLEELARRPPPRREEEEPDP